MDELELHPRMVLCRLREADSLLLPCQAGVAELVHVVHCGKPTYHAASRQPAQAIEVEVAEPCMPGPRLIRASQCRVAHRLRHPDCELVQPGRTSLNFDEEPTLPVPHPENSSLDQHLAPGLVELAQTDDVRVQPGYPVYPLDGKMLVRLAREYHHTLPADIHQGPVTELDGPCDARVELCEHGALPSHMTGGTRVEDPDDVLGVALLRQVDLRLLLQQEEATRPSNRPGRLLRRGAGRLLFSRLGSSRLLRPLTPHEVLHFVFRLFQPSVRLSEPAALEPPHFPPTP